MKGSNCSECPQFIKLHDRLGFILAGLGVALPTMLAIIGYGVLQLIDISEKLGGLHNLDSNVKTIETRLNNHLSYRYKHSNLNSLPPEGEAYLQTAKLFVKLK